MNGARTTVGVVGLLLALILVGGGVLVWMAPVPAEDTTPARDILLNIADWMIKASVGALLGFAGSRLAVRRSSLATGVTEESGATVIGCPS